jgi:hypothetical protein
LGKKLKAGRSAGSPQSIYSLAQLPRFGFRVSKYFLFCLICDYKTSGDFWKKNWGLEDQQEVLNLYIPWHNCLVLGSESPNIFCFVLFGIIRLQETYKNILWARRSSESPHLIVRIGRKMQTKTKNTCLMLLNDKLNCQVSNDFRSIHVETLRERLSSRIYLSFY